MLNNKVAVIGSGSWATAIVKILLHNIERVCWWVREEPIAVHLKKYRNNPSYLSAVKFDTKRLLITHNINDAIRPADIILFCIPAAFLDESISETDINLLKDKTIISAIKGIVPGHNQIIADYFKDKYHIPYDNFAVVSGPSHAEEVAREKLTYLTVASQNQTVATKVSKLFACHFIKTSQSDDIFGTEYAPVIKNIIAIASGICNGLGYGDNFQAVLISNALKEINKLLDVIHPNDRDIKNSVYLGDLLVTCYSELSRNRRFGLLLAKGYSAKYAQMQMNMVAEGYYATKCIKELTNGKNADTPIVDAVYNILYMNKRPADEMKMLENKLS
jgi:glycerol-3-phosphate dehydrogenase (NAD(P)+)